MIELWRKHLSIFTLVVLIFLAGCLGGAKEKTDKPINELFVTANEYDFELSKETVRAGVITITVKNVGQINHEFILLREVDAQNLGPIIASIDRKDLRSGDVKEIQVTLTPDAYELSCHISGHYEKGMKAILRVVD